MADIEAGDLPPFLAGLQEQFQAAMARPMVQKSFDVPSIGRVVIYKTHDQSMNPVQYPAIVMDVASPGDPFSRAKIFVMRDSGPQVLWAYYAPGNGSGWAWPVHVAPVVLDVPAD